jgi:hypothetical protein
VVNIIKISDCKITFEIKYITIIIKNQKIENKKQAKKIKKIEYKLKTNNTTKNKSNNNNNNKDREIRIIK